MTQRILFSLCIFSALICANDARAIMLWKIEHQSLDMPSYLFGTYHSRDEQINTLPKKITQVLSSTQTLYAEIKLTNKSHEMIQDFMQYTDILPLKERLSTSVYKRLKRHIKHYQIPLSEHQLSLFKTWAIALLFINHAESKVNPKAPFMDERLVNYAHDIPIPALGLETPEEQLINFDVLSPEEQEFLLLDSMNQIDNPQYIQAIQAWYRKGELIGFEALQEKFKDENPQIRALDEKLYETLLERRNIRFMQRIHDILHLQPHKNYFFAVGVGHLVEVNGLIALLRKKGYHISKVD